MIPFENLVNFGTTAVLSASKKRMGAFKMHSHSLNVSGGLLVYDVKTGIRNQCFRNTDTFRCLVVFQQGGHNTWQCQG